MSTFATVAATIVLAVGIAAAIPAFGPDQGQEAPTQLAFDAPGVRDGTTQPAVSGDDIPSTGSGSGPVTPLSPADCTVEPRSREEVLEILSIAPADDPEPPGGWETPSDQIPVDELNQVYREWQACTRYGTTLQTMALETPALIRTDIYSTWEAIERMANVVPYSKSTLNEILDGRELIDAEELTAWQEVGFPPVSMLQIDEREPVLISEDGTYITVDTVKITPSFGERYPRDNLFISFELVDGKWLLADMDSIQLD